MGDQQYPPDANSTECTRSLSPDSGRC